MIQYASMGIDPSAFDWKPYVVHGTRHPGVWISGLEESGGRELTARIEPGGFTNAHTHGGTETITILRGKACITVDGVTHDLKQGTTFVVRKEAIHSLKNAGDEDLFVRAAFEPSFFEQETLLR